MSVTVRCPKCGSNAQVILVRHPFIHGKSDTEMRCMFCGARRYGAEAERLIEQARAEAERIARERAESERRAREAERIAQERAESERLFRIAAEWARAEAERERVALAETVDPRPNQAAARQARIDASRLRRERLGAAHDAAVAERGVDAVCESPLCANPRPPGRRYCGKKCSDDVARDRHNAKKAAEGPTT